jgi:NADH dehydrogenase [ubiquinone] 1 alpha subcomplex assembly factor 1
VGDDPHSNHGQVVEPQREMLTQKVRTVGMSLIDRIPGPFDLSISKIWATNCNKDDHIIESFDGAISGLPNWHSKHGDYSKSVRRVDSGLGEDPKEIIK